MGQLRLPEQFSSIPQPESITDILAAEALSPEHFTLCLKRHLAACFCSFQGVLKNMPDR